jgi:hypothetical protein
MSLVNCAWFGCGATTSITPKLTDEEIKEALASCVTPRGNYQGKCTGGCKVDCTKKTLSCECGTGRYYGGEESTRTTTIRLSASCYYRVIDHELKCGKEECPLSYVEI